MQNLYDILGVTRGATNREINAALRQLVRRFNEETSQGTRDSADALKIINHTRITFADPDRRARYDAELLAVEARQGQPPISPATGTMPQPAPDAPTAPATAAPQPQGPPTSLGLPPLAIETHAAAAASAAPLEDVPAMTAATARPVETTIAPLTLNSIVQEAPAGNPETRAPFTTALRAAVKGFDFGPMLATRGTATQRSAAPRPLPRLAARLIDYGLWGIFLLFLLQHMAASGIISTDRAQVLANPLIAPILIVFSWAWVEAILLIFFPITPGKFLLNIHVAFNVSNPYSVNDPGALVASSFGRAFRVWWRGAAAGLCPFYLLTMAHAWRKLATFKETTWDFDGDCLVTHGKVVLPGIVLAAVLLAGGGWFYVQQWTTPLMQTFDAGWRIASTAATGASEMVKAVRGDMPSYGKQEIPAPPPRENRTVALEQEARQLLDQRAWQDLSEHCRTWTREDDRNASAWFCYGKARHELRDYTGAIAALKRAAYLAPQNDDIRRLLQQTSQADMQQRQMRKRIEEKLPQADSSQQ